MAVPLGTAKVPGLADHLQADMERAVAAWLDGAGASSDRDALQGRLRFARAVVNRLEIGFSRDAQAFDRVRDASAEERTVEWMRRELSMSANAANAALQVGWHADDLPESVAAAAEGRIGFGHLAHIATTADVADQVTMDAPVDELVMAGDQRPPLWSETALLAQAETQPIGKFATTCLHLQHALDADRVVRTFRTQSECQRLELWPRSDGTLGLHGWLDPENGAMLRAALEPLAAPREPNDRRKLTLRYAEALGELASMALDEGRLPSTGGVRPHLAVTVGVDALMTLEGAGAAEAELGVAFSDQTARRLSCDATVSRVLIDARSVPLDVGREVRVVPPALRRALVVRDRGCRWPGCGASPSRCHAHHVVHWADGGPTNLANCCLLCRRHHRELHEGEWEVRGDANGELEWRRVADAAGGRHGRRAHNWLRGGAEGMWPEPPPEPPPEPAA